MLRHKTDNSETKYITEAEFGSISTDAEEIMKMLRSIIITKKKDLATKALSVILVIAVVINFMYT
jgi:hypothetical protein